MNQSSAAREVDEVRARLTALEAKAKTRLSALPDRPQQLFHTAAHMRRIDAFAAEARADLQEIAHRLERLVHEGWVPAEQLRYAKSNLLDLTRARTLLKFRKQAFMTQVLEWAAITTPRELDARLDPSPWQFD